MKVYGLMIKQMDMACILIWMELNMKASGKMINNMEKVKRHGQTVPFMMEITLMEKNMEKEYLSGLTEPLIEGTFTTITSMDSVLINGLTVENKCTVTVSSNGQMEEGTKVVM